MVVNSDLIKSVLAGVKTEFDIAYMAEQEGADWQSIATEVPSNLATQDYAWLGAGPVMEQFIDEVREQEVSEKSYRLSDILYKAGMAVKRTALEDDQYGLLLLRARGLAREAVRHWNELAYTALPGGFSRLCYDGQNFFDTDHSEGQSGTQSNKTSASLSDAALTAALTAMRGFKLDNGKPGGFRPDTLVVGPANERLGSDLLGSDVVVVRVGDGTASSGATGATNYNNFHRGKYTLVVNEYISGYNWFFLDTSREVKPIIIQNRSDVPITLEDDFDQASSKIKEKYLATVRGRYAQGYGLWQTAFGSDASS